MILPQPALLGLRKSFGFGDRLGLATPGHLAALGNRLSRAPTARPLRWSTHRPLPQHNLFILMVLDPFAFMVNLYWECEDTFRRQMVT
jgi:hypothetical protein